MSLASVVEEFPLFKERREKVLKRGLRLSEVTVEYVSKEPLTFIL